MSLGISSSPTAFERAAASESSSASVHAPRRRITYVFMSSPYLVHGARFSLVASARTGDCPSQSYGERNCGCTAYAGGMSTRVRPPVLRTVRAPLRVGALVAALARGRSYRDALRHILENEQFDRIIVSVPEDERSGLTHDD